MRSRPFEPSFGRFSGSRLTVWNLCCRDTELPWQLVSFEQVVLRSHAPLAWTRLLVLDERGSRLSASLASRLRCPHPPPAEVTAIHLRDAVRLDPLPFEP